MDNKQRNLIKNKILKCLTEDFANNQALFDKKEGWQVFNGTDLTMVMDAVVLGLELAKHDINEQQVNSDDLAEVGGSLPDKECVKKEAEKVYNLMMNGTSEDIRQAKTSQLMFLSGAWFARGFKKQ